MIPKHLNQLVLTIFILYLTSLETSASYIIPKPIIRVFRPRGFEASIPHVAGLQEFIFSANLNEPLLHSSDPREVQFCKSAYDPDPAGRMTVQDRVAKFRLGDKMYYDVVVKKDDEEYTLSNQVFTVAVHDFFRQPPYDPFVQGYHHQLTTPSNRNQGASTTPSYFQSSAFDLTTARTTTYKPANNNTALDDCNAKIFSLVEKVSSLVTEIERLTEESRLLYRIADRVSDGKKLFLRGKISSTDDPAQVVLFVLSEKLGLTPRIMTAKRNEDNLIQFEVESLEVKLDILRKVDAQLQNSKSIKIFD